METVKHTPKPWFITEGGDFVYALNEHGENSFWFLLQSAGTQRISVEELKANARIAAAAPDLLAALQGLLPAPLTGDPTPATLIAYWEREKELGRGEADAVLQAYAAISKATIPLPA